MDLKNFISFVSKNTLKNIRRGVISNVITSVVYNVFCLLDREYAECTLRHVNLWAKIYGFIPKSIKGKIQILDIDMDEIINILKFNADRIKKQEGVIRQCVKTGVFSEIVNGYMRYYKKHYMGILFYKNYRESTNRSRYERSLTTYYIVIVTMIKDGTFSWKDGLSNTIINIIKELQHKIGNKYSGDYKDDDIMKNLLKIIQDFHEMSKIIDMCM